MTETTVTLTLTGDQADALLSTFDDAERGRIDFDIAAADPGNGYTDEDLANAEEWHRREEAVEGEIRREIEAQRDGRGALRQRIAEVIAAEYVPWHLEQTDGEIPWEELALPEVLRLLGIDHEDLLAELRAKADAEGDGA